MADSGFYSIVISLFVSSVYFILLFSRMYWSELGYQPAINTALMDGTNREFLVHSKLKWPLSLALDAPASRLYWCDSKLRSLESIGLNQSDRHIVKKFTERDTPISVALHENSLYVITQSGTLFLLHKFGKGPLTALAHGLKRSVGLVVFQQQQQRKLQGEVNGQRASDASFYFAHSIVERSQGKGTRYLSNQLICYSPKLSSDVCMLYFWGNLIRNGGVRVA